MHYYINLRSHLLRCVLVLNCLLAKGRICSWRAANYNNVGEGFALEGHIIASLQVQDIFECSFACFKDSRCRSYNFRVPGPTHLCELSRESVSTKPENYTLHGDMIYYDAGRSAGCSSSPCHNGGRCVSLCRLDIPFSFVCDCDVLHTGDMCQNWTEKSKDYDLKFQAKSLSNNVSMAILNEPINALTFCIWFQTTQTGSFGLVGGNVDLVCDEYTRCNFSLKGAKRDFYSAPLNNGDWHSICITWQQSKRTCAAYIDGKTNKQRTFTDCRGNTEFEFSGKPLVLGQSVNSKGEFQESKSFTGSIHGINMWDYAMEENEVFNLATSCSSRVGNVVSWPLFRNVLEGNVTLTEGSLCKGADLSSKVSLRFPAVTAVDRIKYSGSLPSLQAFTLCQWTKIVFMQSESTYFSYANNESPNALFLLLRKDLTIRMFINNVKLQIYRAPLLERHWHHACVTWTNNGGDLKVHIDGSLIRVETGYRNGDVIHGGGILILGQDQDRLGGSFVASQSFVGFLSHLNVWNFVVHSLALVDMATGFGTENGNTVIWKDVIQSQA
ncbi:uncharacterized protein LOC111343986 [Stylophora pistillata]|uniref:uncharacterized protein LOC111343986 n=1 Tax=Stylophora pistillata TaxID=50429 RepID=UPI000C045440|nr:uncharacterized protein LOC111343986 [Stylophora pistillata]